VRPVGSQKEIAVDVRLLSATHKNLAREVEQGRLRQDLYFRINVIELTVPALRERKEDLPALTTALLEKIAMENGSEECKVSDSALQALAEYSFPGNVRELENILQRAATLCENSTIERENLEFISTPGAGHANLLVEPVPTVREEADASDFAAELELALDEDFSLEKHLEAIEIEAIEKALEETRWNKTAAAKKLGMSFRSLRYRLKKLGLE